MSLSTIDHSRALRTDDELIALVEAIRDSPATAQETNWLEWKSGQLALGQLAGKFTVAKAILGFANRPVDRAHRALEGVAYMVVGAEPGSVTGVPATDHAAIEQGIKSYVDGPRWTPRYVTVDGVTVLVVMVEAPRAGDHLHTLQKEYEKNRRGTIFVRGAAQTEPAGPSEIRMLEERLLAGGRQPDVDLTVHVVSDYELVRLDDSRAAIEEWMRRHEQCVRDDSGKPKPTSPRSTGFGIATAGIYDSLWANQEDSTTFERDLAIYLKTRRNTLVREVEGQIVDHPAANTVKFSVTNDSADSVSGARVTATIARGELYVLDARPAASCPDPPRWPDPATALLSQIHPPSYTSPEMPSIGAAGDALVVETAEGWEISIDVGDLAPYESSSAVDITIIPRAGAPESVPIEGTVRAMNRRGVKHFSTAIGVSASGAWSLDQWLDPEDTG